jgi:hypothetical protein
MTGLLGECSHAASTSNNTGPKWPLSYRRNHIKYCVKMKSNGISEVDCGEIHAGKDKGWDSFKKWRLSLTQSYHNLRYHLNGNGVDCGVTQQRRSLQSHVCCCEHGLAVVLLANAVVPKNCNKRNHLERFELQRRNGYLTHRDCCWCA